MKPLKPSLTAAVTDGDIGAVQAFLDGGWDVNKATSGGQTPLILAIVFRRLQILSLLLEAGADPQLRDGLGLNAVEWAERRGFTEALKLLAQTREADHKESLALGLQPATIRQSVPTHKELAPPAERELQQITRSDEKSLAWIAGLKRRIDEKTSNTTKQVQPALETRNGETESKGKIQPDVVRDDVGLSAELPTPEVMVSSGPVTKMAAEALQLQDESYLAESTIRKSSTSSSIKRCPKCKTVYNSELLWYCAIDMTPLVDSKQAVDTPPDETSGVPLVWFLVVLIFVVAGGITYFLIPGFKSEQGASAGRTATEAIDVGNSPLVGGELNGKQVNVPEAKYPVGAKKAHVSGTVTVQVSVDKKGTVIATKVLEGDRQLRSAAIAAARKATFSADKLMGQGAVGTIVYTFK